MSRHQIGFILLLIFFTASQLSLASNGEVSLSDRVERSLVGFIDQFSTNRSCGVRGNDQLCRFRTVVNLGDRNIFISGLRNNLELGINANVTSGLYTSSDKRDGEGLPNLLEIQNEGTLEASANGVNRTIWHEFIHHLINLQGGDNYLINLASGGNGTCNNEACDGAAHACGLDEAYTALLEARHSWLTVELVKFVRFRYEPANLANLNPTSVDDWIELTQRWDEIANTGVVGGTVKEIRPWVNYTGLGDGSGNLSGPFTWRDNTGSCAKLLWWSNVGRGKGWTYTIGPNMIRTLDQAFGIDVDINKIRPVYADKLDRDKEWKREIDDRLSEADANKCISYPNVERNLNPIRTLTSDHLKALSRPDAGTRSDQIHEEAWNLERNYRAGRELINSAETARNNITSAAASAEAARKKVDEANQAVANLLEELSGKLPTKDSVQTLCSDVQNLITEMNKHIELATKYEEDVTPDHEKTEAARKKVCKELKALAETAADGEDSKLVFVATNTANQANGYLERVRNNAEKSKENKDLAEAEKRDIDMKLDRMNSINSDISAFKQKLANLPSLDETKLSAVKTQSEADTAKAYALRVLGIKESFLSNKYVVTCKTSVKAQNLTTQADGIFVTAESEKLKAINSASSAQAALSSLTENLDKISSLEKHAVEVEGILSSCVLPNQNPIEGARASADRANTLTGLANDNWTEAEKCASHIREPRIASDEETSDEEEPSADVPNVLAEGEVEEEGDTTQPSPSPAEAEASPTPGPEEERSEELTEETGELDEWAGPWYGTMKQTFIKVNGTTKNSSQLINEMEKDYLEKKRRHEQQEAMEQRGQSGEQTNLGEALGMMPNAIGGGLEAIGEILEILLISTIDVLSNGVPVGFGLTEMEAGYKIFIPGSPEDLTINQRSTQALLTRKDENTLQANYRDPEGFFTTDIKLVSNNDKSQLEVTLLIIGNNLKNKMPDSEYDSFEIVLRGVLDRREFTYPELEQQFKNAFIPVIQKHMQRLNPQTTNE